MNRIVSAALIGLLLIPVSAAIAQDQDVQARGWDIRIQGFFSNGTKPLIIYTREQKGQWLGYVGSSRDPDRSGNKKTFNMSWYYPDLSGVPITDGKVKGQFDVYLTPDLWIPSNHKPVKVTLDIDATVSKDYKITGDWKVVKAEGDAKAIENLGKSGKVNGWSNPKEPLTMPEDVTLELNLQSALIGGKPEYGNRCMVVWLSSSNDQIISLSHGQLNMKQRAFGRTPVRAEGSSVEINDKGFTASFTIPAMTLDMEPCTYQYQARGVFLNGLTVGSYKATITVDGKVREVIEASFDGRYRKGVDRMEIPEDKPWFVRVEDHKPVKPGEHPRLLFRESDLPALREKMKTPEGKAILKRLGYLLDGKEGQTMTTVFSDATHAYMGGGYKSKKLDAPGAYTIGHAAGYGLLYQLTGEKKYAEYGIESFERALKGQRDRDDRYSFKNPGGALRAGPSLGWYAVGYDLLYDAMDPQTRQKLTKAIAEYSEGEGSKVADLEGLARGMMPPASNHFGMQVGGAAMALLAITGEPGVDQKKIDTLLKVARHSMIRNMTEGFGDGGFFAEGDGTGSMSSQIIFSSALQAWKNVEGIDFINVDRPNARMMTLKWIYQTLIRDGRPDFWPIRGAYGHNVWSRGGMSGAGYFAVGIGSVTPDQAAAMKWYYQNFLAETDAKAGKPYDTASVYPQYAVSAYVNWPVETKAVNPAEVLPLCYRDSTWGFYAWRNRWKDRNDTIITVLTQRSSGYMAAKADRNLKINAGGNHLSWGRIRDAKVKHWSHTEMGQTSSLTMGDGTAFAFDFTGASGEDVLLVTTGKDKGQRLNLGGKTVTVFFPAAEKAPQAEAKGDKIVVGKQSIRLDEEGNLVLEVQGR